MSLYLCNNITSSWYISGFWIGLPGCLEEYDNLVKQFFKAKDEDRQKIITSAEDKRINLSTDSERAAAEMYIKAMKKVVEKGDVFIDSELERLEKLRSGKLSDKKKEQIGERLNILASFSLSRQHLKDEL